jgi:hypothetical protein
VTAKESLRHLVDGLSEEEARVWLERMGRTARREPADYERALGQPALRGETDMAALLGLVDEWLADESGFDEAVLPPIQAALEGTAGYVVSN